MALSQRHPPPSFKIWPFNSNSGCLTTHLAKYLTIKVKSYCNPTLVASIFIRFCLWLARSCFILLTYCTASSLIARRFDYKTHFNMYSDLQNASFCYIICRAYGYLILQSIQNDINITHNGIFDSNSGWTRRLDAFTDGPISGKPEAYHFLVIKLQLQIKILFIFYGKLVKKQACSILLESTVCQCHRFAIHMCQH